MLRTRVKPPYQADSGRGRLGRAPKIATGILVVAVLVAVFGPMISPWDATESNLVARQLPPAWMEGGRPTHWFGTDRQGRDILTRSWSARASR